MIISYGQKRREERDVFVSFCPPRQKRVEDKLLLSTRACYRSLSLSFSLYRWHYTSKS